MLLLLNPTAHMPAEFENRKLTNSKRLAWLKCACQQQYETG
jgi:hypothetical protein